MMKQLMSFMAMTAVMAFTTITTVAQPFQRPQSAPLGPSVEVQLKAGDLTMTIDAGRGGKIMSLKHGDKEVISQSHFPEAFGSTFWTSPQKEWNWPPVNEFDKGAYNVEEKSENKIVMSSEVSEKLKYRIRKEFVAIPPTKKGKEPCFSITYSIVNESDETRQVAPWEITRVTNENGFIFFDAPLESITPANLLPFKSEYGVVWYQTDEANENRKINADGKGWLAYCANGLLLIKQFEDLKPSQPAPNEAEIQVYVNRGKSYIELESQGAYTTLKPGEQLSWTVKWNLLPVTESQPSAKLVKKIKSIIGKSKKK